jgi:hypothetical protein
MTQQNLIDEFGAEFAADPPRQATLTRMVTFEDEGEVRGNLQEFGDHLHATIRHVRDRAVARQRTGAALDFGDPPARTTFDSTSISKHVYPSPGSNVRSGIARG